MTAGRKIMPFFLLAAAVNLNQLAAAVILNQLPGQVEWQIAYPRTKS